LRRDSSPAIALVLGALTLLLGGHQLLFPLWFDQGAFATCADVLRRGGAMWRDCWEVRGTLTPLLYALPALIDDSSLALQAFNLIWQWASGCVLAWLAWRLLASRAAALLSGVLYLAMHGSLNHWAVAQAEGFANLFIALAIALLLTARPRVSHAVLAGACGAALFWLKYPLVLLMVLPFALAWQRKRTGALLLGLGAALAASLLPMLVSGAWDDWLLHLRYDTDVFLLKPLAQRWDWLTGLFVVEVSTFIQQGNTPTAGWKNTVAQTEWLGRGYPWLMLLLALALGQTLAWRKLRSARLLLIGWLALAIGLNILQGHSYRYHFVIWLAPMALLGGSTLAGFVRWGWSELAGVQRVSALICAVLFLAGSVLTIWPWSRDAWQNLVVERKALTQIHDEALTRDYDVLARWLRDNSAPEANIVVFSDVPAVYRLAGRAPGTRFPYFRWAEHGKGPRAEYEALTIADMQRTQPRYFVLSKERFPWPEARFIDIWKSLPALNAFVEREFQYVTDVGPFVVFARR
jgi:hypothetical protein